MDHSRAEIPPRPLWRSLIKLARPVQWSKGAFVLIGPAYGLHALLESGASISEVAYKALLATAAFALASSSTYVVNDILDREADRLHPRKRRRPIAAGHVSVSTAWGYAGVLGLLALAVTLLIGPPTVGWVALSLALYVLNVLLYSFYLKHKVIADVICLALGFVLRVMGGCAAVGIEPSVWLLNVTFFLSMFLAFGKRLGERRTLARAAADTPSSVGGTEANLAVGHRRVQAGYTDTLLQMAVVVTAVSTLMAYGSYVTSQSKQYVVGFNLLWLTMLPAFYGMFRCIVKLEQGAFDDPTELAVHDRGFQAAGLAFVAITVAVMWYSGSA